MNQNKQEWNIRKTTIGRYFHYNQICIAADTSSRSTNDIQVKLYGEISMSIISRQHKQTIWGKINITRTGSSNKNYVGVNKLTGSKLNKLYQ